ncbi:hypothetical protein GALL_507190 [mine drainage metagenome]|uniref:Uncharacterized protein n=1 Tax=mine drainage metagenome TaxID=410659 RepID=A0A1J5PJI6_9ZZZZ
MANVSTDSGRAGKANLCVHVGAIHIYLAAVCMNDLTNLNDRFFKHAVG